MKRTLQLTSPRMRGDDVVYAKRLLRTNKYLAAGASTTNIFDEEAAAACRRAKWALGYPEDELKGTFGTKLERFLRGDAELPLLYRRRATARARNVGALAVREAELWVGTKENPAGSNIAKPFTPWYGWIGWGAPWCAVFVSYCLSKAGFSYINPGKARWAYCPYVLRDAKAGLYGLSIAQAADVREGYIVLFDWDNDGIADHIGLTRGIVDMVTHQVPTIEGNTSSDDHGDQSNGGEVCLKSRSLSDVIAFVKVSG